MIVTRFHCRCGFDGRLAELADREGYLLSRPDHDELRRRFVARTTDYLAARDAGREASWVSALTHQDDMSPAEVLWLLLGTEDVFSIGVYTCPECGRIYVQETASSPTLRCYVREEPDVTYADVYQP